MKKKKKSDKTTFGKGSSRLSIFISLIFMVLIVYIKVFPEETGYVFEEKVILSIILVVIALIIILGGSNYIVIVDNTICVVASLNNKVKIQIPLDTIKRVDFYLPNGGLLNANFNIKIIIKGKGKKIDKSIGLSRKEITSLTNILKEQGIEIYSTLMKK